MRLKASDLASILRILEKIDRRTAEPMVPGPVGRFLRQYRDGSATVNSVLNRHGIARRADGSISGIALGAVAGRLLSKLQVSILGFPLGEVADGLAISEELGGLTNIVLWLKGSAANTAFNSLNRFPEITITGDYRWSPPSRLTTGEAAITRGKSSPEWQHARCLKAVADDLIREPHALEYVLDYRLGPPGVKFFRCVCAERKGKDWLVLPSLDKRRSLPLFDVLPSSLARLGTHNLAALLIYREPWSSGWTIADSLAIDANDALFHGAAWADFQREILGLAFDGTILDAVRNNLQSCGLLAAGATPSDVPRSLLPVTRDLMSDIRCVS